MIPAAVRDSRAYSSSTGIAKLRTPEQGGRRLAGTPPHTSGARLVTSQRSSDGAIFNPGAAKTVGRGRNQ
jgi:hypothetical protein